MLRTLFNNRELRKVPLPKKEGLKQKSKLQKLCSPINRNPEAAAKGWLRLRRENFEFGGVKWLFLADFRCSQAPPSVSVVYNP